MSMLKRLGGWTASALLCAIFLAISGAAQAAAPIVVAGELVGASGVNVDGKVYDVQFVEGSCVDIYGGCDALSDFPFTTLATSTVASQALLDQVFRDAAAGNFDTVPNLTSGCSNGTICGAQTPYGLPSATEVSFTSAASAVDEAFDGVVDATTDRTFDSGTGAYHEFATYVVWTHVQPAVPIVVAGELLGASGVDVGGTLYDVQFVDGTCIDIYDGCDDLSDFPFTDLATATLASEALFDQVFLNGPAGNFDTVHTLRVGCSGGSFCGAATPFGLPSPTEINITSAVNAIAEVDDWNISGIGDRTYDSGSDIFHTLTTYAVWTPIPPARQIVVAGQLLGASGVDVGGVSYDVEFVEGSCSDIYDGCDEVSDLPFNTVDDALEAGNALLHQVLLDGGEGNFDSAPQLTFGCLSSIICGSLIPYGLPDASDISAVSAVNQRVGAIDFAGSGTTTQTFDSEVSSLHSFAVFSVWTVAPDPDGDGWSDALDNCPGVANANQTDSDGDGFGDACDNCAADANDQTDTDSDGQGDVCDACPADPINSCADTDSDGIYDDVDNCLLTPNPTQDDVDSDDVGDACDVCVGFDDNVDADGDSTPDACDNCPATPNPSQSDTNGDGQGDACQAGDSDGDGWPDGEDNCPSIANAGQGDGDSDGNGDACDLCSGSDDNVDGDSDGTPDGCDACPLDAAPNEDDDADGVCNAVDICLGDDTVDTDSDGAPDDCDFCPLDATDDSDGDTVCDSVDICAPATGTMVNIHVAGEIATVPAAWAAFISVGDPFELDLLVDTTHPNAVAPPDYWGEKPGTMATTFVFPITGPVTHIRVDDATDNWIMTAELDLMALLGENFPLIMVWNSPLNSGIVPDATMGTHVGAWVSPSTSPRIFFVVNSITTTPVPNSSDDLSDTDGDGTPDGCDACPLDALDDQDGDGVCDSYEFCPLDNPDDTDTDGVCESIDLCQGFDDTLDVDTDGVPDGCDVCNGGDDNADADSDGSADFCDDYPNFGSETDISFDDAYADNGNGFDPAVYYVADHGVTISGTYFGVGDGVSNGDTDAWGLNGTDGPAFLGSDAGLSNEPTIGFAAPVDEATIDVGLGLGDADTLTVTAYLLGAPVDTDVLVIADDLNGEGTWQTSVSTGPLDEVRVTSASGSDFGIDQVSYLTVPEPGAALSLLVGAALLSRLPRTARRRED